MTNLAETQVAAGIMMGDMLAFGSLVERAMEVFLVTLLGVVLVGHWDWRALVVALVLFCAIRPLCVWLMPWGALARRSPAAVDRLVRDSRDRELLLPVLRLEP
ncbi:hypothetical protein ACFS4T_16940 [Pseudomonas lini]